MQSEGLEKLDMNQEGFAQLQQPKATYKNTPEFKIITNLLCVTVVVTRFFRTVFVRGQRRGEKRRHGRFFGIVPD